TVAEEGEPSRGGPSEVAQAGAEALRAVCDQSGPASPPGRPTAPSCSAIEGSAPCGSLGTLPVCCWTALPRPRTLTCGGVDPFAGPGGPPWSTSSDRRRTRPCWW